MRAASRLGGRAMACALLALSGCQLAPPYHPPHNVMPEHYQGAAPFALARPGDALPRGPW